MRRFAFPAVVATIVVLAAPLIFAQPSLMSSTYLPMVFGRPTSTPTPTPFPTIGPTATPELPPPSFNNCQEDPAFGQAPNYPVRIVTVDKSAETVTLQNVSPDPINLDGWRMCSIKGNQQHPIGGPLAPNETKVFPGPEGLIWNNSESDPGALYDPEGRLVSYWPN